MNQYKIKIKGFTEEVWNKKNFQVFDKIIHPDFQYNDPIYPNVNSKDEYKAFISRIQTTSPDTNYEMIDIIVENEKVVVLYSWTGTPVEELGGVPPTGKKLEHKGVAIYYFDNDQVIKIWDIWDRFSVLKQLGIIS
jgi:steroid delta-isomerase-like uncharacterized protein